jgi:hypothetical protein
MKEMMLPAKKTKKGAKISRLQKLAESPKLG